MKYLLFALFIQCSLNSSVQANEDLFGSLLPQWPEQENILDLVDVVENGNTTVTYTLTFDSVWSAATHPTDFPSNPHYSRLIGGNHCSDVSFWSAGTLASPGIKDVAELGSRGQLIIEVTDAITAGTAQQVQSGDALSDSPGTITMDVTVSRAYPLVTMVTMLAPSPDWFAGIHDLDLFVNGQWVDQITIDLFAYDAGTDSGDTYRAPDNPTMPPELIRVIQEAPLTVGGVQPSIGTFNFTLQ